MMDDPETPQRLTKVRFRFTVEVEVNVDDVPSLLLEHPREIPEWEDYTPDQHRQHLELQRSLLHALVKRPDVLAELVTPDAAEAAGDFLTEAWSTMDMPRDHEVLAPILKTLPTYEQVELQAAIRRGVFSELMEVALYEAMRAEVIDVKVSVDEGD